MKTGPRLTVSKPSCVFNVWDYRMLLGFKFTCKKLVLILSTLKCSHGKMNKLQPPVFTWMNFTNVKRKKKKSTYQRTHIGGCCQYITWICKRKPSIWGNTCLCIKSITKAMGQKKSTESRAHLQGRRIEEQEHGRNPSNQDQKYVLFEAELQVHGGPLNYLLNDIFLVSYTFQNKNWNL